MALKDLVPWNRGRAVSVRRDDDTNPFLALHREVNRLFDDVFRGVGASACTALSDLESVDWGGPISKSVKNSAHKN